LALSPALRWHANLVESQRCIDHLGHKRYQCVDVYTEEKGWQRVEWARLDRRLPDDMVNLIFYTQAELWQWCRWLVSRQRLH